MTPESSSPLPPLLIFFVGFFIIISLSRLATRPRARRANGRRFLDYNVIVIALTTIFIFIFISITVLAIGLAVGAAASDRAAAIIAVVLWIIVDTGVFLAIYSMFRSKISFDDSGIYKKMIARPEKFFPWSAVEYFIATDQVWISISGGNSIPISRYLSGAGELVDALRTHNVAEKQVQKSE